MTDRLRIFSVQLNPVMGDIGGNVELLRSAWGRARANHADLVVGTELCLVGYPPEDLVLKPALVRDAMTAAEALAKDTSDGPAMLVGGPWVEGEALYNAVLLLDGGRIVAKSFKHDLPNYKVFDEKRVFTAGPLPEPVSWRGVKLGLPICEDIWTAKVPVHLANAGADMLICVNGSPWREDIFELRRATFGAWAKQAPIPLVFTNQVGGQDELVFDGASFSRDRQGQIVQQFPTFSTHEGYCDWVRGTDGWICETVNEPPMAHPGREEALWRAMALGLADYVNKNGFPGVVLGLSGGIDSAMSAALAVDALGAERVWGVMMPSKHTSQASFTDAEQSAMRLGIRYDMIPIEPMVASFTGSLSGLFAGRAADTTEENLQSRIRAVLLMALSNKFGHMLLTTGNKSEMAVGYATLYGDMCGGYNVLKDLYKTDVFALARWRNQNHLDDLLGPAGEMVPQNVIDKPPSAELKDDQKDEDSLPPYDALDDMLHGLVEEEAKIADIVGRGHSDSDVHRIEHLLYLAEYKRRQAPPGVKLGPRNFGRDRRYPITNKYRDRGE